MHVISYNNKFLFFYFKFITSPFRVNCRRDGMWKQNIQPLNSYLFCCYTERFKRTRMSEVIKRIKNGQRMHAVQMGINGEQGGGYLTIICNEHICLLSQ